MFLGIAVCLVDDFFEIFRNDNNMDFDKALRALKKYDG